MQVENEEEVIEEVTEEENESGTDTEEVTEDEGETSTDATETDDTVTISRTELEKLQRESHAAKRLREKDSKKTVEKGNEQTFDQELVERTFLAAQMQYLDPEVQDEAIRLKEKLGFDSIAKAVSDPDVKMRLDNLIKQKKAQQSVAGGTGGSVQKGRNIDYHVAEYKRTGKLPDDNKLVSQILDKLV